MLPMRRAAVVRRGRCSVPPPSAEPPIQRAQQDQHPQARHAPHTEHAADPITGDAHGD